MSQVRITGRVIGQTDTRPVADASVFISNATIGDKTGTDGKFTLTGVKPGKYELVISIVGFDKYTQVINVEHADINLLDITLFPRTIGLSGVVVKPKKDPERNRNYEWFKEEFLGKSDIARDCKILNPELLDMSYDGQTGVLTASSADFLIIENKALGYRLKYLLQDFRLNNYDENNRSFSYSGSVFFEPLHGTAQEESQWQQKRQEVYANSPLHFLRAALNNRIAEEGFRVLRYAITMNPDRPSDRLINEKI
ncbi:MAG TPA: carboxypeptidase-like regulatory domain-containing protein, partial [Mucilaginibacter sp.]|nr:carboxypeptidase-like regulatory domain-containing protein [Mucilaginibacter sp.]